MSQEEMNWDAISTIAEVIGAAAVVVSLIYVGVQIRSNTIEARAANRQHHVDRAVNAARLAASSPELAGAIAKAAEGKPLSPEEITQYRYFVRSLLYDVQEAYLLYVEGRLDELYWKTRAAIFVAYMTSESAREAYRSNKKLGVLHDDFLIWANEAIGE
jgi:hypothetical protein